MSNRSVPAIKQKGWTSPRGKDALTRACPICHVPPKKVCRRSDGSFAIRAHKARSPLADPAHFATAQDYDHAQEIPCSSCKAPVGAFCVTGGGFRSSVPHKARIEHNAKVFRGTAKPDSKPGLTAEDVECIVRSAVADIQAKLDRTLEILEALS